MAVELVSPRATWPDLGATGFSFPCRDGIHFFLLVFVGVFFCSRERKLTETRPTDTRIRVRSITPIKGHALNVIDKSNKHEDTKMFDLA